MAIVDSKMELFFKRRGDDNEYAKVYDKSGFYYEIIDQELPGINFGIAIKAA
jgi:hypothetical protein